MGLVESWGTGVKRILAAVKSYGLLTPRFQAYIGETSEKHQTNIGVILEMKISNY